MGYASTMNNAGGRRGNKRCSICQVNHYGLAAISGAAYWPINDFVQHIKSNISNNTTSGEAMPMSAGIRPSGAERGLVIWYVIRFASCVRQRAILYTRRSSIISSRTKETAICFGMDPTGRVYVPGIITSRRQQRAHLGGIFDDT